MRVHRKNPTNRLAQTVALLCALPALSLGFSMCMPAAEDPIVGECVTVSESDLDCQVEGYEAGTALDAGLVGYSCTGTARPDLDAVFDEGVPRGLLCADKGELSDGSTGYCCTREPTTCAYNPLITCVDEGSYGYECLGTNRPESLNAAVHCTNGNRDGDVVEYCCAGHVLEELCANDEGITCSTRMMGFRCLGDVVPRGQDLGENKSRADFYYQMCSTPIPHATNPDYLTYCCFMPALVPPGGTCVNDVKVPGCEGGRFGFACYGPDTPEDDYTVFNCPDPGFSGFSAEGYEATLYCCDFIDDASE